MGDNVQIFYLQEGIRDEKVVKFHIKFKLEDFYTGGSIDSILEILHR